MIINKSGIAIRMKVTDLNVIGRATQGVRLINLGKRNDEIASVCKVLSEPDEQEVDEENAELDAQNENNEELTGFGGSEDIANDTEETTNE